MNKTLILGTVLVVFFASSVISPTMAGSLHEFTATAKSDSNEFEVRLAATTDIPQDDAGISFGYGFITAESYFDTILVTTAHSGFFESAEQYGADDPKWHTHYITLTDDEIDNACSGLEVANISFDSPGDVSIHGENISFDGVKTLHSVNPLTDAENIFYGGQTPLAVISFDIDPVFNNDGKLTNICIDISGIHPIT